MDKHVLTFKKDDLLPLKDGGNGKAFIILSSRYGNFGNDGIDGISKMLLLGSRVFVFNGTSEYNSAPFDNEILRASFNSSVGGGLHINDVGSLCRMDYDEYRLSKADIPPDCRLSLSRVPNPQSTDLGYFMTIGHNYDGDDLFDVRIDIEFYNKDIHFDSGSSDASIAMIESASVFSKGLLKGQEQDADKIEHNEIKISFDNPTDRLFVYVKRKFATADEALIWGSESMIKAHSFDPWAYGRRKHDGV